MTGRLWIAMFSFSAAFQAPPAAAVETRSIADDYQLVGIISGGSKTERGIVVLRELASKRTFTVRTGDRIPQSDGVTVKSIGQGSVVLATTQSTVELGYGGSSMITETEDAETRLVNLTDLENFYRDQEERALFESIYTWPEANADDSASRATGSTGDRNRQPTDQDVETDGDTANADQESRRSRMRRSQEQFQDQSSVVNHEAETNLRAPKRSRSFYAEYRRGEDGYNADGNDEANVNMNAANSESNIENSAEDFVH